MDQFYNQWINTDKELRISLMEWLLIMSNRIYWLIGDIRLENYLQKNDKGSMLIIKRNDMSLTIVSSEGLINFDILQRLDCKLELIATVTYQNTDNNQD